MKKIILLLLIVYPIISYTQTIKTDSLLFHEEAGVEFQWYPAGIMPMLSYNYFINGHNAITSRFGVNIANRHDWSGLNDFEKEAVGEARLGTVIILIPCKVVG